MDKICATPEQKKEEKNKYMQEKKKKNPNACDAFTARYDAVTTLLSVSFSERPTRHFSYSHTNVFHLHKSSGVQVALLHRRVELSVCGEVSRSIKTFFTALMCVSVSVYMFYFF